MAATAEPTRQALIHFVLMENEGYGREPMTWLEGEQYIDHVLNDVGRARLIEAFGKARP